MKNNDLSFIFLSLIVLSGLVAACLPSANARASATSASAAPLVQNVSASTTQAAPTADAAGRAQS